MTDTVLVACFSGQKGDRWFVGRGCLNYPAFGCERTLAADYEVLLIAGTCDPDIEGVVRFLKDFYVIPGWFAQGMPSDAVGAECLGITDHVEKRSVVGGSGCCAVGSFDLVWEYLTRVEVFEANRINPTT